MIFLEAGSFKYVLAPADDTDPPTSPYWTVDGVGNVPASTVDNDISGTAGEDLLAGDAVYLSDGSGGGTAGRWYKGNATDAYSSSAAAAVGIAPSAIATGASGSIRLSGKVTLSGLTAGSPYYFSTTPGILTLTPPTNARQVGMAESTTSLVVTQGIPLASASIPGIIGPAAQTISGVKTFNEVPLFKAGGTALGATARSSGVISNQSSSVGISSVGAIETDLFSYTVPANTLSVDGATLRVTSMLAFAPNADTKLINVYFGGSSLNVVNAAINISYGPNCPMVFTAMIIRMAAAAQLVYAFGATGVPGGSGAPYGGSTQLTADLTSDQVLKITGQGTTNGDVVGYNMIVEVID